MGAEPRHKNGKPVQFTPAMECRIQEAWEGSTLSASQIAKMVGTTKSTIIGIANRRGWKSRGSHKPGAMSRLDALHQNLDRVLVATENVGRLPPRKVIR